MDMLAVTAPSDAPEEVLRAGTVPSINPRTADVLDGVFGTRVRVTRDVEGANA